MHYLTLFVVYNHMMPWPLHCKIGEDPIHQRKKDTSQSTPLSHRLYTLETFNLNITRKGQLGVLFI